VRRYSGFFRSLHAPHSLAVAKRRVSSDDEAGIWVRVVRWSIGRHRNLGVTAALASDREAARNIVFRGQLRVDLDVALIVVRRLSIRSAVIVLDSIRASAGNVRCGIEFRMSKQILCRRVGNGNIVAKSGREAGTHGIRGDRAELSRAVVLTCALVVDKEEKAIAEDGAPKCAAKDAAIEGRNRSEVRPVWSVLVRPAVCVQVCVFEEPESIAMELVRAALGHHYDLAAIGVAVLGGRIAGDDMQLADRVDVRAVSDIVVDRLINVGAVKCVVVGLLTVAIDEEAPLYPLLPMLFCAIGFGVTAPATRVVNDEKLRACNGSSVAWVAVIASPVVGFSVLIIGAAVVTTTFSFSDPTLSFASILASWLTSSANGPAIVLLKPAAVMVSL
jgi:hypothetical protein